MKNMVTFILSETSVRDMAEFVESQKSPIHTPGDDMFIVQMDLLTSRGTIQSKRGKVASFNSRSS